MTTMWVWTTQILILTTMKMEMKKIHDRDGGHHVVEDLHVCERRNPKMGSMKNVVRVHAVVGIDLTESRIPAVGVAGGNEMSHRTTEISPAGRTRLRHCRSDPPVRTMPIVEVLVAEVPVDGADSAG